MDVFAAVEVCQSSGDFENAVVGAGGIVLIMDF